MTRKKNDEILGKLIALVVFYLILFWFSGSDKFWVLLFAAITLFFASIVVVAKIQGNKTDKFNNGKDLLVRLKKMTPTQFEVYIADLYTKLGYETEQVGGAYDGGIDVVAIRKGVKHYIQCKKFITSQVGVGDLRNFYGAMAANLSGAKGIFITTNIFTTEAEYFAEGKPLELIDGNKLVSLIKSIKKDEQASSDYSKQSMVCPWCGKQLVKRNSKFGEFIGCSGYPRCKYKQ
jgi:restriction system protein